MIPYSWTGHMNERTRSQHKGWKSQDNRHTQTDVLSWLPECLSSPSRPLLSTSTTYTVKKICIFTGKIRRVCITYNYLRFWHICDISVTPKTACQSVSDAGECVSLMAVSQACETEFDICLTNIWEELSEKVQTCCSSVSHDSRANLKHFFHKNTYLVLQCIPLSSRRVGVERVNISVTRQSASSHTSPPGEATRSCDTSPPGKAARSGGNQCLQMVSGCRKGI